jgi:glycosyltransferase involved in cell wall biosynthesis
MKQAKQRADITYVGFVLGHGGDALQLLDLAVGMTERGRRVRVVVPVSPATEALAERGRERNVQVERIDALRADDQGVRQSVARLLRFLASNRTDLYHFHTGDVCLPRTASGLVRVLRVPPAVITIHSPILTVQAGDARARFWASAVNARRDTVVAPSRHGRATQISLGVAPERVRTIFNCIDVVRFRQGDAERAFEVLQLPPTTPLVVFSSRLDPQKRPLDAVESFRRIVAAGSPAHMAIIGSGVLEGDVRDAVGRASLQDRVHVLGYRQDVPDWLAAATAWILPTEYENFSLAVLEAQAAGCAIVSTRCQGNDEMLHDGVDAITTPVGDIDAQAAALARIIDDEGLRRRLQRGARSAGQQYTLERMLDEHEAAYDDAVARGRARR